MRDASFNVQQLEKEKNVIVQEITEARDDPKDQLHELFMQIMFPNHPLSYPIAGTPATINSFTSEDLKNLHHYNSLNRRLCISVAGNIKHSYVLEKILSMNMQYADIDYWAPLVPPVQEIERSIIFECRPDINQVHTLAGFLTIPFTDERRYGLTVLNNIIGGSTSSRAYQRLREKEALLNYVYSFLDLYADVGLWCLYHVSDIKNREVSLKIAYKMYKEMKEFGVKKDEFERSINYCKGMLALAMENPMARMTRNAQKYLFLKKVIPIEESIAIYDRLTLDQINCLVELFNFDQYSAAIVGPIKREDLGRIGIAPEKIIESYIPASTQQGKLETNANK
jgi:predicted Zn-dependent peptidase